MASNKRRREPTFAEIAAAAREVSGHPLDGRHHNRAVDDGVWDAEGLYWERRDVWLTRGEVEKLLESAVLVVVEENCGARWYSGADGLAVWRKELSARFIENNTVQHLNEMGWPDEVVYSAEVSRRADGSHLVWFARHC